jgi:hypothetical protein
VRLQPGPRPTDKLLQLNISVAYRFSFEIGWVDANCRRRCVFHVKVSPNGAFSLVQLAIINNVPWAAETPGRGDKRLGAVASVELYAFEHVELGLGGLGLLDRDDALLAWRLRNPRYTAPFDTTPALARFRQPTRIEAARLGFPPLLDR